MRRLVAVVFVGLVVVGFSFVGRRVWGQAQQPSPDGSGLRTVADVPLTGGASRFDYQSLDAQAHRLYIAHMGAGRVTVFDTQTGTIVGDVLGVKGVHGALVVPELG